jgi:hypothetical protein
MDSPFKNGEKPQLTGRHLYQIGNIPVFLAISKIAGKPRLSFVIAESPSGVKYDPPEEVHAATFVSDGHALTTVEFLDEFAEKVNEAVRHWQEATAALNASSNPNVTSNVTHTETPSHDTHPPHNAD